MAAQIQETKDRLSDLPDPILHHILSFLEMREITPTSQLSKKWKLLHTSLPFLTFNRASLQSFLTIQSFLMRRRLPKDFELFMDEIFIKFVNRILLQENGSKIQSLNLYWGSGLCNSSHVEKWLQAAIDRNVEEIDLQISTENWYFHLPELLYESKYLKSLKLEPGSEYPERRILLQFPDKETMNLPVLSSLFFKKIDNLGNDYLDMYFSGCPNLERMSLVECDLDSKQRLNFSAPQLKYLVIEILDQLSFQRKNPKFIVISAPNMVSFTCKDYVTHNYSLEGLCLLEVADIQMRTVERSRYDYDSDTDMDAPEFTKEDSKRMMKLLKGVCNVKYLTLNPTFLEVISETPDVLEKSYIPFSNLRNLKLITWTGEAYLRSIVYLLENSPNLETLILEIEWIKELSSKITEYWGEEMVLVEKLKVIQIWNKETCIGHEIKPKRLKKYLKYEVDLLKTFLKYAVQLEKMSIFTSEKWSNENEEIMECFQEEIRACPKASSDAIILFREIPEPEEDEDIW